MDKGHVYADKILAEITDGMQPIFDEVGKKSVEKIRKYLKRFESEIREHEQMVDDGDMTEREFEQWMISRTTTGREWNSVRNEVSEDYHKATVKAMATAGAGLLLIYRYNKNFMGETIEKQVKKYLNKSISIPRRKKPRRPNYILPKSPDPKKNRPWHRKKVESVIRKGMKKGHSVDKIARNLHEVTNMDRVSSYRAVRTGVTSAENEARIDAMYEAEELGIKYDKIWMAVLDARTRTSHRVVNGERIPVDEYFSNGLFRPADPDGEPAEVYNCRCTLGGSPEGVPMEIAEAPAGMGKLEWQGERSMEDMKNRSIQDELLEQVSGGNDAQYAEIMDYIAKHDPAAYAVIQSKPERWRVSCAMRYLYDHGVPVVMTTDSLGDNVYVLGTMDIENRKITETSGRLHHAELMALIHKTLG